ncbi:MAG: hypothetical protein KGH71_02860 [Candidatus Micrarchaeota archaeon]|nr:hypothetical protein [Candidatus Micrarchaeota archaeon]
MLKIKGIIASLELMISLPLFFAAVIFLITSYNNTVVGITSLGGAQAFQLKAYSTSQELISVIDNFGLNFSEVAQLSRNYSSIYLLDYSIQNFSYLNSQKCSPQKICRVVEISGRPYLLVVEK